MQDKLNQNRTAMLAEEARLTRAAIPEWSDKAAQAADTEAMVKHLAPFGITATDLGAVTDHRLLVYVRHQALQAQRLEKLLSAEPKAPRGQKRGRGKAPQEPPESGGLDLNAMVRSGRSANHRGRSPSTSNAAPAGVA